MIKMFWSIKHTEMQAIHFMVSKVYERGFDLNDFHQEKINTH